MIFEWDEAKRRANLAKHGVDFDLAHALDWSAALIETDARRDYRETRLTAYCPIDGRLHVLIFTHRPPAIRVISLRKANNKEVDKYENAPLPEHP